MISGCKTTAVVISSCGQSYSFFHKFIPQYWKQQGIGDNPLHRICSLMRKMKVESFCAETLNSNDCMKSEFDALENRCEGPVSGEIKRISFFNTKINKIEEIEEGLNESFLGYIVIINAKLPSGKYKSYIPQAVMKSPTIYKKDEKGFRPLNKMNQYIHTAKNFDTSINNKKLQIFGSFYCQQNNITNVCAHAALRMIINNLKTQAKNIDYEIINQLLKIDHKTIKMGKYQYSEDSGFTGVKFKDGLLISEITAVLKSFGLKTIYQDCFAEPNMNYADFIYSVVESGYPALLVFTTTCPSAHVVPIIGHTLNTDIWYPEAQYYYRDLEKAPYHPSNAWVDNFVFHDDNMGMYYNLPVKALQRVTLPKEDPKFRAFYAIGILPNNTKFSSNTAQSYASIILNNILRDYEENPEKFFKNNWMDELINHMVFQKRFPVIRTMLLEKKTYLKHLKNLENKYSDNNFEFIENALKGKKWFWMNEITLPDLYSANRTKLGDILICCDKQDNPFLLARLPEILMTPKKTKTGTDIKTHHDMFSFKKEDKNESFEW